MSTIVNDKPLLERTITEAIACINTTTSVNANGSVNFSLSEQFEVPYSNETLKICNESLPALEGTQLRIFDSTDLASQAHELFRNILPTYVGEEGTYERILDARKAVVFPTLLRYGKRGKHAEGILDFNLNYSVGEGDPGRVHELIPTVEDGEAKRPVITGGTLTGYTTFKLQLPRRPGAEQYYSNMVIAPIIEALLTGEEIKQDEPSLVGQGCPISGLETSCKDLETYYLQISDPILTRIQQAVEQTNNIVTYFSFNESTLRNIAHEIGKDNYTRANELLTTLREETPGMFPTELLTYMPQQN